MNRVGQVFKRNAGFWLVTSELTPTRKPGSTVDPEGGKQDPDLPVHTLAYWNDSGVVIWPLERLERQLASWELEGHRIA